MSLSAGDIAFATELFEDLPDLTTRRMFGGMGIYSEGVIFALLHSDGQIMIKSTGGAFSDELEAMGAVKWTYTRKDGAASSMPYYSLPDAALEDSELALDLGRRALAALD
ncbi:TfoX/Sxy family protein [Sulfitobacter mediterraneus]|uniref:TfoX-like protein n=1 Tax=Sulfitobacter mediterraneus TaxID=83219 RepID=A0A061SV76_9RHOB|nr:TfoX/Sxy family protein [Sulfitobacter mediterraneus]KAJ03275.1 TfoX-like protein [Sulfitobacter mediterraneus]MBM1556818.1 TfoX/Sxy family protein [Sulfitobacter mediterraneus]MBM1569003.1 TfoX/Sxy family protein [Sulfitobacter mediterraneus]MBM1572430.1 TfoX/Sxy family protein [Sulfitobacter mediterraneus]MBM1576593.1 TfoX/Sxy family protein [Sulfitobacter mediterraneus]